MDRRNKNRELRASAVPERRGAEVRKRACNERRNCDGGGSRGGKTGRGLEGQPLGDRRSTVAGSRRKRQAIKTGKVNPIAKEKSRTLPPPLRIKKGRLDGGG